MRMKILWFGLISCNYLLLVSYCEFLFMFNSYTFACDAHVFHVLVSLFLDA